MVIVLASCGPKREELQAEIEEAEEALLSAPSDVDSSVVLHLADLYVDYADRFADDSLSPIYLLKCADLMASMGHVDRALEVCDRIIEDHPQFEDLPLCYFFKGAMLEEAERRDEAVAVYEEYLKLFPDHFLAQDLRTMLPLIEQGMSEEEQLEYLTSHAVEEGEEE